MDNQEIFDSVARHLLTQRSKSVLIGGGCAYRGVAGQKCAIGALIPDKVYTPEIEGMGVGEALNRFPECFPGIDQEDSKPLSLLMRLQRLHDNELPSSWRAALRATAEFFSLSPAVLKEFLE